MSTRSAHAHRERFGPAGTPRVVVVGGGYGGIAAGVKMKDAGIHTFTIYEKSERVGGTWWDNQYPGCEVDVHSHLYSFAFKPYDWSRTHAKREELQGYLEETVSDYGLWPHFRLGVAVDRAEWDESTHTWRLTLDTGETDECHVLISADRLPQRAPVPRLARASTTSTGPKFHTARWEHEHDLTGKTIALVGTGSTATQILPEIQPVAGQVYVFQREPGWVMPKGDRDFTPGGAGPAAHLLGPPQGALAPALHDREGGLGRRHLQAGDPAQRRADQGRAATTSRRCSPTAPTSPRR